jgi:hypothetical protein
MLPHRIAPHRVESEDKNPSYRSPDIGGYQSRRDMESR